MAAGQLGAYAVPINWHFTPEEAGYILADSRAKVLVIHADLLAQIASGIPVDMKVLVVPTPPEIGDAYGVAAGRRSASGAGRLPHRHVSAMDVGAVKAPTIWRSQIMQAITTIGLDMAKSVFQVHGVDAEGMRKRHRREVFTQGITPLAPASWARSNWSLDVD